MASRRNLLERFLLATTIPASVQGMSKSTDRSSLEYWEERLFRNFYTYRGEKRQVSGWCVKIQWQGVRRTVRLASTDRRRAAREAMALYEQLPAGGWGGVVEPGALARRGSVGGSLCLPRLLAVSPRKYVSDLRAGRTQEFFAELAFDGRVERIALETEIESEAGLRAMDLKNELSLGGWDRLGMTRSREVTVAVFWQANPMTCTYATLLSMPATEPIVGGASDRARGWKVLVMEPDAAVRRALVRWLSDGVAVQRVVGCAAPSVPVPGESWDLVLANRGFAPAAVKAHVGTGGVAGGVTRVLTHGLFADSDAIFASVSGVSRGYFLQRVLPARLLEPLLGAFAEGPPKGVGDEDRMVRRYFQNVFEPEGTDGEVQGPEFSGRENQVLDLLGRGLSDKEIAHELGISVWTVHSHLKRIFGKYGVRTRTEAVVRHLQK